VSENEVLSETVVSAAVEENVAVDNSNADSSLPEQDNAPEALNEEKQDINPFAAELEILITNQKKNEGLLHEILSQTQYAVQFAEKKQEQIDKLYAENRQYRDGIIEKFKEKLVMGIIEQLDSADRETKSFFDKEDNETNYNKLFNAFSELADDFREMLENRLGIVAYKTDEGEPLDLKRHKVIRSIPTGEKERGKTIMRSTRYGYETEDGKVLRPEFVDVYHYDTKLAEAGDVQSEVSAEVTGTTSENPPNPLT
jgi:molecular chaperone GrpE (heat shock protein)